MLVVSPPRLSGPDTLLAIVERLSRDKDRALHFHNVIEAICFNQHLVGPHLNPL